MDTVDLLESDEEAAATVRARKRWFSVDEYQDTNPLQQRLLELWLGERRDLCVVGDEDQTIYTFTGATSRVPDRLRGTLPGRAVVTLAETTGRRRRCSRSPTGCSPRTGRRSASWPPAARPRADDRTATRTARRSSTALTAAIRDRLAEGIAPSEIAVLVRMNAQLAPIEAALTRAGIAYQVRGLRFFDRPEVRGAVDLVRRCRPRRHGVRADSPPSARCGPSGSATTTTRSR